MPEHMWIYANGISLSVDAPEGPLLRLDLPMAAVVAKLQDGELLRFTYDVTDPEDGSSTHGAARLVVQELPDPRACGRCGLQPGAHAEGAQDHLWIRRMAYQDPPAAEVQPAPPADATACKKCGNTFVEDGKYVDSAARDGKMPYCRTCVGHCHDTEIADHWCEIDQYSTEQQKTMKPAPPADACGVCGGSPDVPQGDGTTYHRYVERPSGPPVRVPPATCAKPGCGEGPSAHLGWALGHLYRD